MVRKFTVPRLTITLSDEQAEKVEQLSGEGGPYESKSEVVRMFIQRGERVDELEQKVERLEREKQLILEDREERNELVRYVEDELTYREAGLSKRVRWWLFGRER